VATNETIKAAGDLPERHDLRPLHPVFTAPWSPELGPLAEQFFPRFHWIQVRPGKFSGAFLALLADDPAPIIALFSSDPGPTAMAEMARFLRHVFALPKRPAWMWPEIKAAEEWEPWKRLSARFREAESGKKRDLHKLSWLVRAESPSRPFNDLFQDFCRRHGESATEGFVKLLASPPFTDERDRALRLFSEMQFKCSRGNRPTPIYRERETKKINEAERKLAVAAKHWRARKAAPSG
jgi:hypothetical protein